MEGKNLEKNVEEAKKTDNVLQEDEVIDYEKVVYDRDDFVDEESYINYCKDKEIPIVELATKKDDGAKKEKPKLTYGFVDLKSKNAIQNFCIAGNEIYVTQKAGKGAYRISRCQIEGDKATYKDSMKVVDGGHGQTLETYKYKGNVYLLIGVKINAIKKEDDKMIYWSTQLARIKYIGNEEGSIEIKSDQYDRLIYLSYSYRTSDNKIKSNGAVKRCDAAISADNKSLVIWQKLITGEIQYNIYNFETINKLWDKTKVLSFKDNKVLQNAWISSAHKIDKDVYSNSSFQGIEITNAKNMYITSGKSDDKQKLLSKVNDNGSICVKRQIDLYGKKFEIEGVKIIGEYLYIALVYNGASYIERLNKSEWN